MDSATIAIVISIVSLIIAVFGLSWNIYRDIILKARVVVAASIKRTIYPGAPAGPNKICIVATNHGPGPVTINGILARDTSIWKKLRNKQLETFLLHDLNDQSGHILPSKLEVGETANLFFEYRIDAFLKTKFSSLGVTDTFGRVHKVSKKDLRKLYEDWNGTFNKET